MTIQHNCFSLPETVEETLALIAKNPREPDLYQHLGGLLFCQRDLARAWDAYMEALKLNPKDPFTCLYFGNLLTICDCNNAMKLYRQAAKYAPRLAVVHWSMADLFRKLGQFAKADKAYRKAVEVEPDNEQAREKLDEWKQFRQLQSTMDTGNLKRETDENHSRNILNEA